MCDSLSVSLRMYNSMSESLSAKSFISARRSFVESFDEIDALDGSVETRLICAIELSWESESSSESGSDRDVELDIQMS